MQVRMRTEEEPEGTYLTDVDLDQIGDLQKLIERFGVVTDDDHIFEARVQFVHDRFFTGLEVVVG